MKKPEKYFEDFCLPSNDDLLRVKYDVLLLIKQVQIDAIKETCKRCSDEAEMTGISYRNDKSITDYEVDKNSILSVADKLIKELEDGNKD